MGSKEGLCLWCGSYTEHRSPDGMADCYRIPCIEKREYEDRELPVIGRKWVKDGIVHEIDTNGDEVEPFFYTEDHYRKIVTLLTAGDVAAEYEHNGKTHMVVVRLVDGTKVFWAPVNNFWRASLLSDTGTVVELGPAPFVNLDSSAEWVTSAIAKFDYATDAEPEQVQGTFREPIVDEPVEIAVDPNAKFLDLMTVLPEAFEMMQNASLEDVAKHLDGKAKERAHSRWEDIKAMREDQPASRTDPNNTEWDKIDPNIEAIPQGRDFYKETRAEFTPNGHSKECKCHGVDPHEWEYTSNGIPIDDVIVDPEFYARPENQKPGRNLRDIAPGKDA